MMHDEFKAARKTLGLTQGELGRVLDLNETTVRRYEMPPRNNTARAVHPTVARVMRWLLAGFRPEEWPQDK